MKALTLYFLFMKVLSCDVNWYFRSGHVTKVWWLQLFHERSYDNLNFIRIDQKVDFFELCSWFKFKNLGLTLLMALKFYTSVKSRLNLNKTKNQKIWGAMCYRGKSGKGLFCRTSETKAKNKNQEIKYIQ